LACKANFNPAATRQAPVIPMTVPEFSCLPILITILALHPFIPLTILATFALHQDYTSANLITQ
jgi:hypothetical protein